MSTAAFTTTIGTRSTAAGRAIARLNLRQVRLGTLVVATVCAGMSALVAVQYRTTFEGALDRSALRALVENPAIRIIFGPPVALDDAGGFTVWRTGTPLLILGSVWILLAATRITRGEEDAGRYELLLAGPLRKVSLVLRSLAAVTTAALVISAAVGIALVLAGTDITGAVVHAAAVFGVILTFATGAVLAAQIMPTRSSAIGLTVALLGRGPAGTDACRRCAAVCLVSMDDPVRPGRAGRPLRSQPGRPVAGSRSLPDNARAGRAGSSAIPRRRQRRGEHVDASRAANQALEIDRRVCGSPLDRAHTRLGDRHRRLLFHPRDADRIHPRVLQHQSPIRRAGRRRRIRRSGLGERLRRGLVQPAGDTDGPLRGDAARPAGRRRTGPPMDRRVRHRCFANSPCRHRDRRRRRRAWPCYM